MGSTLTQMSMDARGAMPNASTTPINVDVILLSREESLLFNESMQFNLKKTIPRKKF
jgi:hypothetical protein